MKTCLFLAGNLFIIVCNFVGNWGQGLPGVRGLDSNPQSSAPSQMPWHYATATTTRYKSEYKIVSLFGNISY